MSDMQRVSGSRPTAAFLYRRSVDRACAANGSLVRRPDIRSRSSSAALPQVCFEPIPN